MHYSLDQHIEDHMKDIKKEIDEAHPIPKDPVLEELDALIKETDDIIKHFHQI